MDKRSVGSRYFFNKVLFLTLLLTPLLSLCSTVNAATINGSIDSPSVYSINTHSFTVSRDGAWGFDISFGGDLSLWNRGIRVFESDGTTEIKRYLSIESGDSRGPLALRAGNYLLQVEGVHSGNYTINTTLMEQPINGDNDFNDNYAHAQMTTIADGMSGHLGYRGAGHSNDIEDWWQISLSSETSLGFTVTKDSTLPFWNSFLNIYENDGDTLVKSFNSISDTVDGPENRGPVTLSAGTYYLKIFSSEGFHIFGGYQVTIISHSSDDNNGGTDNSTEETGNNDGHNTTTDPDEGAAGQLSSGELDGRFGSHLSAYGDRLLVSAYGEDENKGAAYIYKKSAGQWVVEDKLLPSVQGTNYFFGISGSLGNGIAVVGASAEVVDGNSRGGAVYVFRYNSSTGKWVQSDRLTASDVGFETSFGSSVSVDNERILVGALGRNSGGSGSNFWSGRAYVYDYNTQTATWSETRIYNPEPTNDDYFGRSVALDGDTAIIGADHGVSHPSPAPGQAYIFVKQGSEWVEQQELLPSTGLDNDANYGIHVAVKDDLAFVGAITADVAGTDSGAVYIYKRSGSTWTHQQTINAGADEYFSAVSFNGKTVAVGASHARADNLENSGMVYLFEVDGSGVWQLTKSLEQSPSAVGNLFGGVTAITSNHLFVGATGANDNEGLVWFYTLGETSDIDSTSVCNDATLSVDLKLSLPILAYQPLLGDMIMYWAELQYVAADDDRILFEVTDYGELANFHADSGCDVATLSAVLDLHLPKLIYDTGFDKLNLSADFSFAPQGARIIFNVDDYQIH